MKDRKRSIAIELATGLAIATSFMCMGCGETSEVNNENSTEEVSVDNVAETESESEDKSGITRDENTEEQITEEQAAAEQTVSEPEVVLSAWTKEGNYIDGSGIKLVMYRTYAEYGYSKDGWGAMLLPGDDIYTGDLDEVDGQLCGTLSAHADDGTATVGIDVMLTDMGDSILLQKENGKEISFLPDATDYSDPNYLPMFSYDQVFADYELDPLEAAAYDYLSFDYTNDYDVSNVIIPYVKIVDIDETNPKDVLLYGDYYAWEFKKEGDTLVAVSGGHCPGIIHLESSEEDGDVSYSAIGVMDEAFTDEDTKTLFGKYYESYHEISSDEQIREPKIAQVIADYVAANDLDVIKYRFGGEAAKELPTSHLGR